MHTARIPPADPASAIIAAVLATHPGHISSLRWTTSSVWFDSIVLDFSNREAIRLHTLSVMFRLSCRHRLLLVGCRSSFDARAAV